MELEFVRVLHHYPSELLACDYATMMTVVFGPITRGSSENNQLALSSKSNSSEFPSLLNPKIKDKQRNKRQKHKR